VVVWTSEPEVPVTVTLVVPVVAVADAVKVKVEVALPFAGGVTGLVEKGCRHTAGECGQAERGGRVESVHACDRDSARSVRALVHADRARRSRHREAWSPSAHGEDQIVMIVVGARGAGRCASQVAELRADCLRAAAGQSVVGRERPALRPPLE